MFPKGIASNLWASVIRIAGVCVPGLPKYADQPLVSKQTVVIPPPEVFTIDWTTPASTGNGETDFPPSCEEVIIKPDWQIHPGLYKAAMDTIRLSNDFFVKSGCRSVHKVNGYPKKDWVLDLAEKFAQEFKDEDFVLPPDLRTLWVTDKNYHPSDKVVPWENRLWVEACHMFKCISNDDKRILLTRTEAEQQTLYAASFSDVTKYNDFLVEMFMTYLAHEERETIKQRTGMDQQPSEAELDALFQMDAHKNGATLYDLHRTFYNVTDIKEFIRRIEYFATYVAKPKPAFGQLDTPEGAYFRKPIPSITQIREALHEPMTIPELFQSLAQLYEEYSAGVGSQTEVLARLLEIAAPDITTGLFIHKETPCPDEAAIWNALEEGPLSTKDLAAVFPNRISSEKNFNTKISSVAYRDEAQGGRWVRMFLNEHDEVVGEKNSRKIYALHKLLHENPMKVLDWTERVAMWDGETFVDEESPLGSPEPEDVDEIDDIDETDELEDLEYLTRQKPQALKIPEDGEASDIEDLGSESSTTPEPVEVIDLTATPEPEEATTPEPEDATAAHTEHAVDHATPASSEVIDLTSDEPDEPTTPPHEEAGDTATINSASTSPPSPKRKRSHDDVDGAGEETNAEAMPKRAIKKMRANRAERCAYFQ